jgi:hypothetical protein
LTNGGITSADVRFTYLPGDLPVGPLESGYNAYRIKSGAADQQTTTLDTVNHTATVPGVSQFSDWTLASVLAPTAAMVTVGGQVRTENGRGIRNVIIGMTDSEGQIRTARTNSFGYYRFYNAAAGETYILTAKGRRYTFSQPSQVINLNEDNVNINFTGNLR